MLEPPQHDQGIEHVLRVASCVVALFAILPSAIGCRGARSCDALGTSPSLTAQPEVPFEAYPMKETLSPAQRQLTTIYRARHKVARDSGWSVRFFELEQVWLPDLRLIMADGYLDAGHDRLQGQVIGIDALQVVEVRFRERHLSTSEPVRRLVEGIATCRWRETNRYVELDERLRRGDCQDRTPQLLASLHDRSKRPGGDDELLLLARDVTTMLFETSAQAQIVSNIDQLPEKARWYEKAPTIAAPTVTSEGDVLRAHGFLKATSWVGMSVYEFDLEATRKSLRIDLTDTGFVRGFIY